MESVLIAGANKLENLAHLVLSASPYRQIRELQVRVTVQGVLLEGVVASYYHKQLAQEILRELALSVDLRVINRVVVSGESVST